MSCIQLLELNPSCNSSEKENQISVIWSDDQNCQNEPKKSQRSLQHQVDYSPINPIIDTNVSKKETTIKANIELLQDAGQPEPLVTTSLGRTVKQPSHLIDFVTYLKIQTWEKNKCQKVDLKRLCETHHYFENWTHGATIFYWMKNIWIQSSLQNRLFLDWRKDVILSSY